MYVVDDIMWIIKVNVKQNQFNEIRIKFEKWLGNGDMDAKSCVSNWCNALCAPPHPPPPAHMAPPDLRIAIVLNISY